MGVYHTCARRTVLGVLGGPAGLLFVLNSLAGGPQTVGCVRPGGRGLVAAFLQQPSDFRILLVLPMERELAEGDSGCEPVSHRRASGPAPSWCLLIPEPHGVFLATGQGLPVRLLPTRESRVS